MRIGARKTRIIATLGPSSDSKKTIQRLYDAGVSVFRINCSHGTWKEHTEKIERIRQIKTSSGCMPAVLTDLQGPKIRTGEIPGPMHIKTGSIIELRAGKTITSDALTYIPVPYSVFLKDIKPGERVLVNDGAVVLKAVKSGKKSVLCKVQRGGEIKTAKGINLPDTNLRLPSLTKKDKEDALNAVKSSTDYLALSFVRKPGDIRALRNHLKKYGFNAKIIAKIEKPSAVENIEEIIKEADAVMVARGDLGVELSPEKVPVIQKRIIKKANMLGKPVITATQMLETMIDNPFPTRAESSDIANAVFDGTDCVMLSGETAAGGYPVESVKTMARILENADKSEYRYKTAGDLDYEHGSAPHAVAEAAYHIADEVKNPIIAVFTSSGSTAIYLSKLRPEKTVIALTPGLSVCRSLSITRGVCSLSIPFEKNTDRMIESGIKAIKTAGLIKRGSTAIFVAGTVPSQGGTNMIKVRSF